MSTPSLSACEVEEVAMSYQDNSIIWTIWLIANKKGKLTVFKCLSNYLVKEISESLFDVVVSSSITKHVSKFFSLTKLVDLRHYNNKQIKHLLTLSHFIILDVLKTKFSSRIWCWRNEDGDLNSISIYLDTNYQQRKLKFMKTKQCFKKFLPEFWFYLSNYSLTKIITRPITYYLYLWNHR